MASSPKDDDEAPVPGVAPDDGRRRQLLLETLRSAATIVRWKDGRVSVLSITVRRWQVRADRVGDGRHGRERTLSGQERSEVAFVTCT